TLSVSDQRCSGWFCTGELDRSDRECLAGNAHVTEPANFGSEITHGYTRILSSNANRRQCRWSGMVLFWLWRDLPVHAKRQDERIASHRIPGNERTPVRSRGNHKWE